MKKIISIVVFLAAMTMPAKAQADFGVKGGLNVTSMSFSKDVFDSSNQTGFFIGPTVKFTLPVIGLGFDASLLFDQRTFEVEFKGTASDNSSVVVSDKISQQSIQIPVHARFGFGLGDAASIYVFAGPQFGFNLSGKKNIDQIGEWSFDSSNLSANIGVGVMLFNHLQASVNYNCPLGKTGEFDIDSDLILDGNLYNQTYDGTIKAWQLSVVYYF